MESENPDPLPEVPVPVLGDVCFRKRRRKRQKKLLKKLFLDFAKNTTLHGLRYTTESGLSYVEKIFWFVMFFASMSLCFFFIGKVWYKWQTSPVIVSFGAQQIPVDEVPFPSVTICPLTNFRQDKFNYSAVLEQYEKQSDNFTDNEANADDIRTADALNLLCDIPLVINGDREFLNAIDINRLIELSLDHRTVFKDVSWLYGSDIDVELQRVLTRDGVCYNFNGLQASEILTDEVHKNYSYLFNTQPTRNWTVKHGYTSKSMRDVYPFKGKISMSEPNLVIVLSNIEEFKDTKCNALYSGYEIYLHHPLEFPQAQLYYFAALPKYITSMGVKFTVETANPKLRDYPVEIRRCYFPEDKPLRFFRHYSYNNCILECQTNFTYEQCGCVQFYMPFNDSSKICPADFDCLSVIEGFSTNLYEEKCKCLPACHSIHYDAEIHKSKFSVGSLKKAHKEFFTETNTEKDKLGKLEIFYKQPVFRVVHRSVLFELSDFLGNCGGILGLCLGFSWLSLVEIFYFLTFRVYNTIRTDLKEEKAEFKMSKKY